VTEKESIFGLGKLSGKVSGDRGALRAITLALMWEFLDLQAAHREELSFFSARSVSRSVHDV